jgi:glycosyltransferase involved in cell wall biosynthesis
MKTVFTLAPNENWIVDRFVKEWNADNPDIVATDPQSADVIWLLSDWCWRRLPITLLGSKTVVTTVHHIVPEKFGPNEHTDFMQRDQITDVYHVYNFRTFDFISQLTKKLIRLIPYWANQSIWKKTGEKIQIREKLGLPGESDNVFIVGSFQRDTEGYDLVSPKLEKGPDLFVDAVVKLSKCKPELFVLLGGWRRQYVIARFKKEGIPYKYIELPPQETINEMYQALDLYLVTARHEGGPQALIECGLLDVPCRSRPVGIAEMVLPCSAVHDDVTQAMSVVPFVEGWMLPYGYEPYRRMFNDV